MHNLLSYVDSPQSKNLLLERMLLVRDDLRIFKIQPHFPREGFYHIDKMVALINYWVITVDLGKDIRRSVIDLIKEIMPYTANVGLIVVNDERCCTKAEPLILLFQELQTLSDLIVTTILEEQRTIEDGA